MDLIAGHQDTNVADVAFDVLKQKGIVFSSDQIAEAKHRAQEFMRTNPISPPKYPGL